MNEGHNMIGRNNLTTATTADVELKMVMTRFFDASPKLVFKAYTDPISYRNGGALKGLRLPLLSRWK